MRRSQVRHALRPATRASIARPAPFPWWLLILATIFVGLIWWSPWSGEPARPIDFQAEGPRVSDPMCLAMMIDESGSMSESDPAQARSAALLGAASFLSVHGLAGDRIAAGWFADDAAISELMDGMRGQRELPSGPTVEVGGGTDLTSAVEVAGDALWQCPPGTRPALALVTDGIADDFAGVGEALGELPERTTVHLVAVNAAGSAETLEEWRTIAPQLDFVPVRSLDRSGVGEGVASLLSTLTGQRVEASPG